MFKTGYMMTRKNGLDQFLQTRKRRMPSKINTSFLSREWEDHPSTLKEEVCNLRICPLTNLVFI